MTVMMMTLTIVIGFAGKRSVALPSCIRSFLSLILSSFLPNPTDFHSSISSTLLSSYPLTFLLSPRCFFPSNLLFFFSPTLLFPEVIPAVSVFDRKTAKIRKAKMEWKKRTTEWKKQKNLVGGGEEEMRWKKKGWETRAPAFVNGWHPTIRRQLSSSSSSSFGVIAIVIITITHVIVAMVIAVAILLTAF